MVLKALALLHEGTILVGGLTSRGLGRVELADGVSIERTNARLLLAGLPAERATFTDESRRADGILRDLLAPKES
jgi:CRISPR/Cas system CSM-associated protein Csm3 (group 7 of RAMP superfamily)